jgi:hypothetical protein
MSGTANFEVGDIVVYKTVLICIIATKKFAWSGYEYGLALEEAGQVAYTATADELEHHDVSKKVASFKHGWVTLDKIKRS